MGFVTDDAAAREERLRRFAEEQHRLHPPPPPPELREGFVARLANRVLDRGIDTGTFSVEPEHAARDNFGYVASAWHILPRALRFTGVAEDDVFVDYGCGRGRAVHQAARRPFRKVYGVEIAPALAESARANLAARAHQHRCKDVEIVVADAKDFDVPDDLTIAYFFQPFWRDTFQAVLDNLIASVDRNPRRLWLIYAYPLLGSQVLRSGRFRLVKQQRNGLRADSLYRTAIYESC